MWVDGWNGQWSLEEAGKAGMRAVDERFRKENVPSVFLATVIILVLALVATVVPLLIRQGERSASAKEHGEAGESLEFHD